MARHLPFTIDRSAKVSLAEQIRKGITTAIDKELLVPGARLPLWRDLAAQLGVARGTVRAAYERLIDAQLTISSTPAGLVINTEMLPISPAQQRLRITPSRFR